MVLFTGTVYSGTVLYPGCLAAEGCQWAGRERQRPRRRRSHGTWGRGRRAGSRGTGSRGTQGSGDAGSGGSSWERELGRVTRSGRGS